MSVLLDRIPPHNLDAERAVLGALLIEGRAAVEKVAVLRPTDFYHEGHRTVFDTMLELAARGEPIDPITLSEALRRADNLEFVGGAPALALLEEQASIRANLPSYAAIVRQMATLRELIQSSTQIITQAFDAKDDAQLVVDQALGRFEALARRATLAETPFPAMTGAELLALEIPDPEFIVKDWIPAEGLTFIVGDSEAFKSWFAGLVTICIAAGVPLFDRFAVAQRPALVISEENGLPEDKRRYGLIFRGLGLDPATVPWHIASETSFSFDDPAKYAAMRAYVQQHGIKVIVFDSFVRMHRREEKDAGEMNALYLDRMKPLIREGCALLMLHHKRKLQPGAQPANASDNDDIRGSGDLRAAAQAVLFLKAAGNDKAIVKHNKARGWKKQEPYVFGMTDVDDGQRMAVAFSYEGKPAEVLDKSQAARGDVLLWANERGLGLPFTRQQLLDHFKGRYSKKVLEPVLKALVADGNLKLEKVQGQRAPFYMLGGLTDGPDDGPESDADVPF